MTPQIETAEHDILLVEHAHIRPMMSSTVDRFILVREAVVPITPQKPSLHTERSRRPPAAGALK